mmetsp:Transcript_37951/g.119047  ORF Transcript_37951/g.119047 Transcript_37951/m.119047 type:complete len:259 (+) Transcript_37951:455-1231(+)
MHELEVQPALSLRIGHVEGGGGHAHDLLTALGCPAARHELAGARRSGGDGLHEGGVDHGASRHVRVTFVAVFHPGAQVEPHEQAGTGRQVRDASLLEHLLEQHVALVHAPLGLRLEAPHPARLVVAFLKHFRHEVLGTARNAAKIVHLLQRQADVLVLCVERADAQAAEREVLAEGPNDVAAVSQCAAAQPRGLGGDLPDTRPLRVLVAGPGDVRLSEHAAPVDLIRHEMQARLALAPVENGHEHVLRIAEAQRVVGR